MYNVVIGLLGLTIRCIAFLVHLEISLRGLESNVLNLSKIQEDQTGGLVCVQGVLYTRGMTVLFAVHSPQFAVHSKMQSAVVLN